MISSKIITFKKDRVRPRLVAQLVTSVDPRKMGDLCPKATAVMFESPTQQLKGMRMDRQDWLEKYHGIKISGSRDPPEILKEYPIDTLAKTTFPYDDQCAVMIGIFNLLLLSFTKDNS